jgi:hypothetical protein
MQAQYIVQKALSSANGMLPPGTVVDPTGWRNLQALIDQRYICLVTSIAADVQAKASAPQGRKQKQGGK